MTFTLLVFAVVGCGLIAGGRRLGRGAYVVAAVAPASAVIWTVTNLSTVAGGGVVTEHHAWVDQLSLNIDLRLDGLAATMTLIVATVGLLVFAYCVSYFAHEGPPPGQLAGLLVLFGGGMIGVVTADNLIFLYVCWEITTVTSYFLIGTMHTQARARGAALQALLVTSAGGLAMLGGFVILGISTGTYQFSEILDGPLPGGASVTAAIVLIAFGAFTKSAQYPFHSWLPGAMEAPTPVSAYLHSATMVKAGVYLVARFAPLCATLPVWRPLVVTVGVTSLIMGGLRALRQVDLKILLAHGTVSQLGLMVVLFGLGTPATTRAGWMLLIAHTAFKATLFMVVGILDHTYGTRSIGELPVPTGPMRLLEGISAMAIASMVGIPLFAGFIAKETIYAAFLESELPGGLLLLSAIVIGSVLTVAYGFRFHAGAFLEPRRRARTDRAKNVDRARDIEPAAMQSSGSIASLHSPPSYGFLAPPALLAAIGLVLGVAPNLIDAFGAVTAQELHLGDPSLHLELWHGWNLALGLSALTLVAGTLLGGSNRQIRALLAMGASSPKGDDLYLGSLRMLTTVSRRVTAIVQNGSLPVYLGVIVSTVMLGPLIALLVGGAWPGLPRWGSTVELILAIVLATAALSAAAIRRRFSAAVYLSIAGYAMAAIFVMYGAPDLALTQVAVETLSTVVFVFVLRRLPDGWRRTSTTRRRVVRLCTSIAVGLTVFVFAITSASVDVSNTVSTEMLTRALPDGHGHNVVNVILVDFRGFDTLGEITVLVVAAIGAVAIARSGRRGPVRRDDPGIAAIAHADSGRRIVFVDVAVQVVFHAILMASVWLLFAGHNQPGGGFVGGLLAGSAFTLRYIAGGMTAIKRLTRFPAWTVLGAGLLLAASTATVPLLFGRHVLDVANTQFTAPVLGQISVSSALAFDLGVYLVVIGMVLMAFEAFGDKPAESAP